MSDPLTKGIAREATERSSKRMRLTLRTSYHGGTIPSKLEIPRDGFKEIKQSYI